MQDIDIDFDKNTQRYTIIFDNHGDILTIEIKDSLTNQIIKQYLQRAEGIDADTILDQDESYNFSDPKVQVTASIAETIKQIAFTEYVLQYKELEL